MRITSSQFHPHLFIVRLDEEREKREKRENDVAQGYDTNMRKHPSVGNREIRTPHHGESLRSVITESPAHCSALPLKDWRNASSWFWKGDAVFWKGDAVALPQDLLSLKYVATCLLLSIEEKLKKGRESLLLGSIMCRRG